MIQETQSVILKSRHAYLPGFQTNLFAFTITNTLPNKFLGSMNSKMKKDIQLSLVNIMSFRYLDGLVTLVIKRSLDQFADVGSSLGHKNGMFCFPGVVFFSQICLCRLTLYTNRLKCIK